jgi:hypothetical protein
MDFGMFNLIGCRDPGNRAGLFAEARLRHDPMRRGLTVALPLAIRIPPEMTDLAEAGNAHRFNALVIYLP